MTRTQRRGLFSLKGWDKSAQGNALGPVHGAAPSPEGAAHVSPLQGSLKHTPHSQGVALGWHVSPLRGCRSTIRNPQSAIRNGFTLIELLVVIAIIGVLMSLLGAALFKTIEVRKARNTQYTLNKLYGQLQRQMKAVIDDARTETIPQNVMTLANNDPNRARILWIKLRLKQQFPMSYNEAINPGNGYIQPERAYLKILNGKSAANNPATESAACLLMALTARNRRGVQQDADFLSGLESFDSDGDTIPEIVDGYGTAVVFYRWPTPPNGDPNYIKLTSSPPNGWNPNPSATYQDPQDPTGTLQNWSGGGAVGIPTPNQYLVPVIVSAGPDKLLGLDPTTMATSTLSQAQDNLYSDPTQGSDSALKH